VHRKRKGHAAFGQAVDSATVVHAPGAGVSVGARNAETGTDYKAVSCLYLNGIVEAADRIAEFIAGIDPQGFQNSELVRSAVVQKLGVIGEEAAHVSEELIAHHPEIPWPQIV
jgi:hypothetical protein